MNLSWPILPPPSSTRGQLFGALSASGRSHEGLDMGSLGDVVRAAADGVVVESRVTGDSRGRIIRIDHGNDETGIAWETRYYHLLLSVVTAGARVSAGDPIAKAGMSGLPLPHPHLHFEVRRDGRVTDPMASLPTKNMVAGGGGIGGVLAMATVGALVYVASR